MTVSSCIGGSSMRTEAKTSPRTRTLLVELFHRPRQACVQYVGCVHCTCMYTIHVYVYVYNTSIQYMCTICQTLPLSKANILNPQLLCSIFLANTSSLCLFEEHSSQKLLNKFSWKLRICMILTHLTNALFTTKES